MLNPRSYITPELWTQAPILKGTTKFEPLADARNIMVAGGARFTACWFVRHLTLTYPIDYNAVSFDKLDYCATLNNTWILEKCPNFAFEHGDITSPNDVKRCSRKNKIDTIFHFAAKSYVDLSFERARAHGIKRFVYISTDEVYGDVPADADDLSETSLLAPTNPYSASKAAIEMMVNAYRKSFKLPVITVHSNNVYGPHQFQEKIIPKFALLLQRRSRLLVHRDGTPT